jgi:hypothetical protein
MNEPTMRRAMVWWVYATVIGHLAAGLLLPWIMDASLFDAYHRAIEQAFWGQAAPPAARAQQLWWIALFGPTVQGLAVWMAALVRIGEVHRSRFAWGALIAGIVLWAPQDIFISLRAACWPHVWIDCVALVAMLPPLAWLWKHDKNKELA